MDLSAELISSLLSDLYEAAAAPAHFRQFVERVVRLTNSSRGYFVFVDAKHDCDLFLQSGYSADMSELYSRDFIQRDLVLDSYLAAQARTGGDWIGSRQSVLDDGTYFQSDIYNGFIRLHGDQHLCGMALGAMPDGVQGGFALQRAASGQDFDREDISLLTILAPHIKRALLLHRKLSELRDRSSLLTSSIEAFDIAVISLRANGDVIRMSPSAAEILAAADGLAFRENRLRANVREEDAALERLVHGAASVTAANAGDAHLVRQDLRHAPQASAAARRSPASGGSMLVTRRGPLAPLQVVVFPFHSQTALLVDQPAVLVFLTDPMRTPPSRGQLVRALYGLSPMEARLADCLVQGTDVKGAAAFLNLSESTARFYLKSIYRKTGVKGQSALVRLMLQLPGEATNFSL